MAVTVVTTAWRGHWRNLGAWNNNNDVMTRVLSALGFIEESRLLGKNHNLQVLFFFGGGELIFQLFIFILIITLTLTSQTT